MAVSPDLPFKLGRHEPGVGVTEHRYANVFQKRGSETLVAPDSGQIDLFLRLVGSLEGPFRVVYVLLVPLGAYPEGRYELLPALDYPALELLLHRYRDFFERDARHHLVVGTIVGDITVRYDQHDYIRVEGPFPNLTPMLQDMGFVEGEVAMPIPHSHHHHEVFDVALMDLLGSFEWRRLPLTEDD